MVNIEQREFLIRELLIAIGDTVEATLDVHLEEFEGEVLEEYRESDEFVEDACEFCREAGWREPE